jgi:hypothetical protein
MTLRHRMRVGVKGGGNGGLEDGGCGLVRKVRLPHETPTKLVAVFVGGAHAQKPSSA